MSAPDPTRTSERPAFFPSSQLYSRWRYHELISTHQDFAVE
jgi:hypothetical protein